MRPLPPAVHVVTGVLLLNMLVALLDPPPWVYFSLFAAGPFLMGWLVWTVLHDTKVPPRDLSPGAEGLPGPHGYRSFEGMSLPMEGALEYLVRYYRQTCVVPPFSLSPFLPA